MLGIEDKSVCVAYILCIASTLLCVVYGALNWNKGCEPTKSEDLVWVEEEKESEKEL